MGQVRVQIGQLRAPMGHLSAQMINLVYTGFKINLAKLIVSIVNGIQFVTECPEKRSFLVIK